MLGEFDFHLLQVRYIIAAMGQLPTFMPLAKDQAKMQTEYDDANAVRSTYQSQLQTLNLARGELHEKTDEAHQAAIGVYGVMKTRYRKDPGSLEAIKKLPTQDQTYEATRERMDEISSLWSQLPNDPHSDPPGPFVAWGGMDQAAFDASRAVMTAAHNTFVTAEIGFQKAEGDLHATDAQLNTLAVDSLAEGRAQFLEGTPEREVIDAIPTEPAQQKPNQAVIGVAESPAAGQVHLEYSAAHATSYDVFQRLAGDEEFALVAGDVIEVTYDASGLADGTYEYQVVGRNSRGEGPASEVAAVVIGVAQTFDFNHEPDGEGGELVWFQQPNVAGVTEIFMREGTTSKTEGVVLQPGQSQLVFWNPVTITGEIDEIVLRDADGNVLATGVRNTELPNPGP